MQIDKFKGADFKYDNSFLKILAQNYPNKTFLVPNLAIFIISRNFAHKILQFDQYEGADFKFNNRLFKILAQKYPNKVFLVPSLSIFVVFFSQQFPIRQIQGR